MVSFLQRILPFVTIAATALALNINCDVNGDILSTFYVSREDLQYIGCQDPVLGPTQVISNPIRITHATGLVDNVNLAFVNVKFAGGSSPPAISIESRCRSCSLRFSSCSNVQNIQLSPTDQSPISGPLAVLIENSGITVSPGSYIFLASVPISNTVITVRNSVITSESLGGTKRGFRFLFDFTSLILNTSLVITDVTGQLRSGVLPDLTGDNDCALVVWSGRQTPSLAIGPQLTGANASGVSFNFSGVAIDSDGIRIRDTRFEGSTFSFKNSSLTKRPMTDPSATMSWANVHFMNVNWTGASNIEFIDSFLTNNGHTYQSLPQVCVVFHGGEVRESAVTIRGGVWTAEHPDLVGAGVLPIAIALGLGGLVTRATVTVSDITLAATSNGHAWVVQQRRAMGAAGSMLEARLDFSNVTLVATVGTSLGSRAGAVGACVNYASPTAALVYDHAAVDFSNARCTVTLENPLLNFPVASTGMLLCSGEFCNANHSTFKIVGGSVTVDNRNGYAAVFRAALGDGDMSTHWHNCSATMRNTHVEILGRCNATLFDFAASMQNVSLGIRNVAGRVTSSGQVWISDIGNASVATLRGGALDSTSLIVWDCHLAFTATWLTYLFSAERLEQFNNVSFTVTGGRYLLDSNHSNQLLRRGPSAVLSRVVFATNTKVTVPYDFRVRNAQVELRGDSATLHHSAFAATDNANFTVDNVTADIRRSFTASDQTSAPATLMYFVEASCSRCRFKVTACPTLSVRADSGASYPAQGIRFQSTFCVDCSFDVHNNPLISLITNTNFQQADPSGLVVFDDQSSAWLCQSMMTPSPCPVPVVVNVSDTNLTISASDRQASLLDFGSAASGVSGTVTMTRVSAVIDGYLRAAAIAAPNNRLAIFATFRDCDITLTSREAALVNADVARFSTFAVDGGKMNVTGSGAVAWNAALVRVQKTANVGVRIDRAVIAVTSISASSTDASVASFGASATVPFADVTFSAFESTLNVTGALSWVVHVRMNNLDGRNISAALVDSSTLLSANSQTEPYPKASLVFFDSGARLSDVNITIRGATHTMAPAEAVALASLQTHVVLFESPAVVEELHGLTVTFDNTVFHQLPLGASSFGLLKWARQSAHSDWATTPAALTHVKLVAKGTAVVLSTPRLQRLSLTPSIVLLVRHTVANAEIKFVDCNFTMGGLYSGMLQSSVVVALIDTATENVTVRIERGLVSAVATRAVAAVLAQNYFYTSDVAVNHTALTVYIIGTQLQLSCFVPGNVAQVRVLSLTQRGNVTGASVTVRDMFATADATRTQFGAIPNDSSLRLVELSNNAMNVRALSVAIGSSALYFWVNGSAAVVYVQSATLNGINVAISNATLLLFPTTDSTPENHAITRVVSLQDVQTYGTNRINVTLANTTVISQWHDYYFLESGCGANPNLCVVAPGSVLEARDLQLAVSGGIACGFYFSTLELRGAKISVKNIRVSTALRGTLKDVIRTVTGVSFSAGTEIVVDNVYGTAAATPELNTAEFRVLGLGLATLSDTTVHGSRITLPGLQVRQALPIVLEKIRASNCSFIFEDISLAIDHSRHAALGELAIVAGVLIISANITDSQVTVSGVRLWTNGSSATFGVVVGITPGVINDDEELRCNLTNTNLTFRDMSMVALNGSRRIAFHAVGASGWWQNASLLVQNLTVMAYQTIGAGVALSSLTATASSSLTIRKLNVSAGIPYVATNSVDRSYYTVLLDHVNWSDSDVLVRNLTSNTFYEQTFGFFVTFCHLSRSTLSFSGDITAASYSPQASGGAVGFYTVSAQNSSISVKDTTANVHATRLTTGLFWASYLLDDSNFTVRGATVSLHGYVPTTPLWGVVFTNKEPTNLTAYGFDHGTRGQSTITLAGLHMRNSKTAASLLVSADGAWRQGTSVYIENTEAHDPVESMIALLNCNSSANFRVMRVIAKNGTDAVLSATQDSRFRYDSQSDVGSLKVGEWSWFSSYRRGADGSIDGAVPAYGARTGVILNSWTQYPTWAPYLSTRSGPASSPLQIDVIQIGMERGGFEGYRRTLAPAANVMGRCTVRCVRWDEGWASTNDLTNTCLSPAFGSTYPRRLSDGSLCATESLTHTSTATATLSRGVTRSQTQTQLPSASPTKSQPPTPSLPKTPSKTIAPTATATIAEPCHAKPAVPSSASVLAAVAGNSLEVLWTFGDGTGGSPTPLVYVPTVSNPAGLSPVPTPPLVDLSTDPTASTLVLQLSKGAAKGAVRVAFTLVFKSRAVLALALPSNAELVTLAMSPGGLAPLSAYLNTTLRGPVERDAAGNLVRFNVSVINDTAIAVEFNAVTDANATDPSQPQLVQFLLGLRCYAFDFNVTVSVVGSQPVIPQAVMKAAEVTAVAAAGLAGVMGQPNAAMQGARVASVLSSVQCRFSHTEPLDAMVSPTGWAFGAPHGAYYRGGIAGSILLFVCFNLGFLLIALGLLLARRGGADANEVTLPSLWRECLADARFPSVAVVPISLGLQGLTSMSTAIFIHATDQTDMIAGVAGILFALGSCGTIAYVLTLGFACELAPRGARGADTGLAKVGDDEAADGAGRKSCLARLGHFLFGSDLHWVLKPERTATDPRWKKRYFLLFVDYRVPWWVALECGGSFVVGIFDGVRKNDRNWCLTQAVVTAVFALVYVLAAVCFNISFARFHRWFVIGFSSVTFATCALAVVALAVESAKVEDAVATLAVMAMFMLATKVLVDLFFLARWACAFRSQLWKRATTSRGTNVMFLQEGAHLLDTALLEQTHDDAAEREMAQFSRASSPVAPPIAAAVPSNLSSFANSSGAAGLFFDDDDTDPLGDAALSAAAAPASDPFRLTFDAPADAARRDYRHAVLDAMRKEIRDGLENRVGAGASAQSLLTRRLEQRRRGSSPDSPEVRPAAVHFAHGGAAPREPIDPTIDDLL